MYSHNLYFYAFHMQIGVISCPKVVALYHFLAVDFFHNRKRKEKHI